MTIILTAIILRILWKTEERGEVAKYETEKLFKQ